MKLMTLVLALLFITSCGEQKTRIKIPDNFKADGMSFKTYHKYCGPQNLHNKQNFSKMRNAKIKWKGTVYLVVDDDASTNYAKKTIKVKMDGTSSAFSDITLRMPTDSLSQIEKLKKGDIVQFIGVVSYIGSGLNDHVVTVSKYKFTRPKKK